MFKKRFTWMSLLLVILLLSVLALGGCDTAAPPVDDDDDENGAPAPDPDPDPDPEFKTVRIGYHALPRNFNPYPTRITADHVVSRTWQESLSNRCNETGEFFYELAESITKLDSLTYEIKIRQGVTFHNGDPMTVDDVVYSMHLVGMEEGMWGETSTRRSLANNAFTSVEAVDDTTIIVEMATPHVLPATFYNVDVVPKKLVEELGPDKFFEHPIGTGPFKFVEGDVSSRVVFERYEDYWGGPEGLWPDPVDRVPAVDRLILEFIVEPTTRIAALMAGDVDLITNVDTDSVPMLEADPNIQVKSTPGTLVMSVSFNVTRSPFDNKLVRHAIAYAIDYDMITDVLYSGYSDPLYGRVYLTPWPGDPGFEADAIDHLLFEYNPEKAKELLEQAGYPDGFREVLDSPIEFAEQAQAIAQMLNDIGLEISVRTWERTVLNDELRAGNRAFAMHLLGQGARQNTGIWNRIASNARWNVCSYSNPVFDELMETALAMDEDSPERDALIMEGIEIAMDELPQLWVHNIHMIEAAHINVRNFVPAAHGRNSFHRIDIKMD